MRLLFKAVIGRGRQEGISFKTCIMQANHPFIHISAPIPPPINKKELSFTPGTSQHAMKYRPGSGTVLFCVKSCLVLEAAIQKLNSMSEGGRCRLFTAVGREGGRFCCHGNLYRTDRRKCQLYRLDSKLLWLGIVFHNNSKDINDNSSAFRKFILLLVP
jgi:hypothetical protein